MAFTKKQNAITFQIQNQMQTLPMSTLRLDRERHSFFDLGLKKGLKKTGFILVRFPLQTYLLFFL